MTEMVLEQRQSRASALRPIIAQVLQLLRSKAQPEGGIKIAVGPHTIELSSWERAQLAETAANPDAPTEWAALMLDGVAVQARGLNDLVRLAAIAEGNNDQRERCMKDLVLDLAIGYALRTEIERLIASLDEAGKRGHAKNLGAFLGRLSQNVDVVRAALSEPDANAALTIANDYVQSDAAPDTSAPSAGRTEERATAATATTAEPETTGSATPAKKKGIRTKHVIFASVAMVVLVVGAMVGIPMLTESYSVNDGLRYVRGVQGWSGVPPLATVTVRTESWKQLDGPGQTAMVFAIAAAVKKDGYTRADIVTSEGKVVARWDNTSGVSK